MCAVSSRGMGRIVMKAVRTPDPDAELNVARYWA
jgi:hypothetical protein